MWGRQKIGNKDEQSTFIKVSEHNSHHGTRTTHVGKSTLKEQNGLLGVNLGCSTDRNDEGQAP